MQTTLDCIPCFVRQTVEAVRLITDNKAEQTALLKQILSDIAQINLERTPPEMGRDIHRIVRQAARCDPYAKLKTKCNTMAAKMLPEARAMITQNHDPFETAIRFALAGNTIDAGIGPPPNDTALHKALAKAAETPIEHQTIKALRQAVRKADKILFLGDNAGEIFFDKLLLEQMPREKIIYVVRGEPIINDATRADAEAAGIGELVRVMDNGSDGPGTILADCSKEFLEQYTAADLIIAKGQGNFETLSEEMRNIFFLLRAKCPVIASHVGCPIGTFLILRATRKQTVMKGAADVH